MSTIAAGLVGGGLLKGVGSLIGGNTQANAYRDAANQSNQSLSDFSSQMRGDFSPYTSAGSSAIGTLSSDLQNGSGFASPFKMSDFYSDPGYQFTLQQGQNAINNSAAAKGGLLSGAATKGLAQYSSGLANQAYGDAFNRYMQNRQQGYNELSGVAGLGENATSNMSNIGANIAGQKAQNTFSGIAGAGNAMGAGISGALGAAGGGVSTLGQFYALKGLK